jgi:hypothetical protein
MIVLTSLFIDGLLLFKEERLRMMRHINKRRFLGVPARSANTSCHVPHVAEDATSISINGESSGRTFDGVGGLSSDRGTSHLLLDSPAQQQSEILDDFFKPNYEQGGNGRRYQLDQRSRDRIDAQSYQSELPSWLRIVVHGQAKARNSTIKFYGRKWGAPGWFQASSNIDATHPLMPGGWENIQRLLGRDLSDRYGAAQFAQRLSA